MELFERAKNFFQPSAPREIEPQNKELYPLRVEAAQKINELQTRLDVEQAEKRSRVATLEGRERDLQAELVTAKAELADARRDALRGGPGYFEIDRLETFLKESCPPIIIAFRRWLLDAFEELRQQPTHISATKSGLTISSDLESRCRRRDAIMSALRRADQMQLEAASDDELYEEIESSKRKIEAIKIESVSVKATGLYFVEKATTYDRYPTNRSWIETREEESIPW